jgi:hypothetical protein
MATQEFVVPRSIPMTLAMIIPLLGNVIGADPLKASFPDLTFHDSLS